MTKELNVKRNITLDVANIATVISKKVSLSCGVSTYKNRSHLKCLQHWTHQSQS